MQGYPISLIKASYCGLGLLLALFTGIGGCAVPVDRVGSHRYSISLAASHDGRLVNAASGGCVAGTVPNVPATAFTPFSQDPGGYNWSKILEEGHWTCDFRVQLSDGTLCKPKKPAQFFLDASVTLQIPMVCDDETMLKATHKVDAVLSFDESTSADGGSSDTTPVEPDPSAVGGACLATKMDCALIGGKIYEPLRAAQITDGFCGHVNRSIPAPGAIDYVTQNTDKNIYSPADCVVIAVNWSCTERDTTKTGYQLAGSDPYGCWIRLQCPAVGVLQLSHLTPPVNPAKPPVILGQVLRAGEKTAAVVGSSGATSSNRTGPGAGSHVDMKLSTTFHSKRGTGIPTPTLADFEHCVQPLPAAAVSPSLNCEDKDGDGYVAAKNPSVPLDCPGFPIDCDDRNSSLQARQLDGSCLPSDSRCEDLDGDGYFAGAACPFRDEDCAVNNNQFSTGCQQKATCSPSLVCQGNDLYEVCGSNKTRKQSCDCGCLGGGCSLDIGGCVGTVVPITANGTLATPSQGSNDGTFSTARFNLPKYGTVLPNGNLAITDVNVGLREVDFMNRTITTRARFPSFFGGVVFDIATQNFVVASTQAIYTVPAGGGVPLLLAGSETQSGDVDGPRLVSRFNDLRDIVLSKNGLLYIADSGNNKIRLLDLRTGVVSTFAGVKSERATVDGPLNQARFNDPSGLFLDVDNLFVSHATDGALRKISLSSGVVTTLYKASTPVHDLALFNGKLCYSVKSKHTVECIPSTSTAAASSVVIAGSTEGHKDGLDTSSRLKQPWGLISTSQGLFVLQWASIRRVK